MDRKSLAMLSLLFLFGESAVAICPFDDPSLSVEDQADCIREWITRIHQNINERGMQPSSYSREDELEFENDKASKRGKLDQNFLRFGRYVPNPEVSNKRTQLDRNFLRFGRSVDHMIAKRNADASSSQLFFSPSDVAEHERVKKDPPKIRLAKSLLNPAHLNLIRELSWKRGALERNFLRFGRSDSDAEETHHLEKRSNLDRNFLRFGRSRSDGEEAVMNGLGDGRKEASSRSWEEGHKNKEERQEETKMSEGGKPKEEKKGALERNFIRFGRRRIADDDDCFDEIGCPNDDGKRSSLDRNFLRFGKSLAVDDTKRAPLDRNFLRFGKRREDDIDFLSEFPMELDRKRAPLDRNFLRFGRDHFREAKNMNSQNSKFIPFGKR